MAIYGPTTGFNTPPDPNTGLSQDLGSRYVSKYYLLDVYPNIVPGRTSPGLWAFGKNTLGALGDGTIVNKSSPVQVGTLTNWKQISAGGFANSFSMAVKNDNTLWCWGNHDTSGVNQGGWLGLGVGGVSSDISSPVQIGVLTNWKQVSAGGEHTAAVKTDGTMWTWGGWFGVGWAGGNQLGLGTMASGDIKSSPVQVGVSTTWKQVSGGGYHTAAISAGTLWTFGRNTYGQLGQGNITHGSAPIQIGVLTNWKQVQCGSYSTIATKTDNTLWIWGHNTTGQLGLGDVAHRSSPVQIGGVWKQASTGMAEASAGIKADGTLWIWGRNDYGQLGLGDIAHRSSPVQVGSLTNWKSVSVGGLHTVASKTDGTIWAWGFGSYGATATRGSSSPVQIASLTSWKLITAGYYQTLAIRDGFI